MTLQRLGRARPRVYVESPYAAPTPEGLAANVAYAAACMRDALERGEAPLASHLLWTQPGILVDTDPLEREIGKDECGFRFAETCAASAFYVNNPAKAWSSGMSDGFADALRARRVPVFRWLGATRAVFASFANEFRRSYAALPGNLLGTVAAILMDEMQKAEACARCRHPWALHMGEPCVATPGLDLPSHLDATGCGCPAFIWPQMLCRRCGHPRSFHSRTQCNQPWVPLRKLPEDDPDLIAGCFPPQPGALCVCDCFADPTPMTRRH